MKSRSNWISSDLIVMEDIACCTNCNAIIKAGSKACPECGSDEKTGWSEKTLYDGLDLPETLYEPPRQPSFFEKYGASVAVIIAIAMIATILLPLFSIL